LFETGKLTDFAPGEGAQAQAFAEDHPDGSWLEVAVPGDVHTTLLAAGRLKDPFYGRQEEEAAWVEDREWWYRFGFERPEPAPEPDERLLLVLHGLDTFVTLWLNGERLGEHRNMFREAVFDFLGMAAPHGGDDSVFSTLSAREREVLALINEGLGNAEIGRRLGITEKTVRNHVSNLFDKLGVWTRAQAIVFARERGFHG